MGCWSVKDEVDLWVFPDLQYAGLQLELESQGAAVWGALSIVIAMLVYWPFAKAAERQRLKAEAAGQAQH